MLKYFIKFVSKHEHAQMLLQGNLFMRPASYYHGLKLGQGDSREGTLSNSAMIRMNTQYAIYCLYSVYENDIDNGYIRIDTKCIKDFCGGNGYAVIIDCERFESFLPTLDTAGYRLCSGEVQYHIIRSDEFITLANNKNALNLFVKHPAFAYQKEYRLIVFETLPLKCDHKIYSFNRPIRNIAKDINISSLDSVDDNYLIPLPVFRD